MASAARVRRRQRRHRNKAAPSRDRFAQKLARGVAHQQAGALDAAEALYREILEREPRHADALNLMGLICYQRGRAGVALDYFGKAIDINPGFAPYYSNFGLALHALERFDEAEKRLRHALSIDPAFPEAHCNLGMVLAKQGDRQAAADCYRQALHLNPDYAEAHNNLGNALAGLGDIAGAIASYREVIRLKPDYSSAHNALGVLLRESGASGEAEKSFRRAVEAQCGSLGPDATEAQTAAATEAALRDILRDKPDDIEALNNLGVLLTEMGRFAEAVTYLREALRLDPDHAVTKNNLANTLSTLGEYDESVALLRKALELKPDYAAAANNLGNALFELGIIDEAETYYRQAIEIDPAFESAWSNLGVLLRELGRTSEAYAAVQKALEVRPDWAEAHGNLGAIVSIQGRPREAFDLYRKALEISPDLPLIHSNLLLSMHYETGADRATLFAEHRRWAERHATPFAGDIAPHANDRDPERRLRVGYLSPDFRTHSVAFFIEPVLAAHDAGAIEAICYADVVRRDVVTERLERLAHGWRSIVGLTNDDAARLMRDDRVDILVDLAGHTARNRLTVFARKPAPVQVSWLGYPDTTGLDTMDYRLTDAWADPEGEADRYHSEELVRLPNGFLCYNSFVECSAIGPLPARAAGQVTFGSFNNLAKVTPEVVALWSEILKAVPDSRLLLKASALADAETRQHFETAFAEHEISAERLELLAYLPNRVDHTGLYNRIDIALDTFPYNGTTTTFEALWMGVPVITLAGRTHAGRVGISILSQLRFTDLIAETPDAYVAKAVKLAADLDLVEALRGNLRTMMDRSSLTDPHSFTRSLEEAYRMMWRRWCAGAETSAGDRAADADKANNTDS